MRGFNVYSTIKQTCFVEYISYCDMLYHDYLLYFHNFTVFNSIAMSASFNEKWVVGNVKL